MRLLDVLIDARGRAGEPPVRLGVRLLDQRPPDAVVGLAIPRIEEDVHE